jgi:hypothetical protein
VFIQVFRLLSNECGSNCCLAYVARYEESSTCSYVGPSQLSVKLRLTGRQCRAFYVCVIGGQYLQSDALFLPIYLWQGHCLLVQPPSRRFTAKLPSIAAFVAGTVARITSLPFGKTANCRKATLMLDWVPCPSFPSWPLGGASEVHV